MDFFAVKVDEVTSTQESVYMKTSLQIPGLTSFPSTLTFLKVHEDDIFFR